jgi:lysozyme family protein
VNTFEQAFAVIIGNEGGFTNNQADPGNWTGGKCGEGECRGTKYGISAKAYPTLDIAGLTLDQARATYKRDYWDRINGDTLPPPLALIVFDAAVNNGVSRARQWLALAQKQPRGWPECSEFQAQRMAFMASLPTWKTFGLGWSRRLARLPYQAVAMTGEG